MLIISDNVLLEKYSWIKKEFLEKLLRIEENDDEIVVEKYVLAPAIGKGENFASDLVRATIDFVTDKNELKNKSLILKLGLSNEKIQNNVDEFDVFHRETILYRDILPKMENYLKQIDSNIKLAPKCYAINQNPKYLILEDLKESGYKNIDRKLGLNFEQNVVLMKKLAKFHAASAMIVVDSPSIYLSHNVKTINVDNEYFTPLFVNGIKTCAEACKSWPGYERFTNKLTELLRTVMQKGTLAFMRDDKRFNVLNHGDLWINNLMFRFDEEESSKLLQDVVMVDFQSGFYGSPAIDLAYLLFTSTANEIKEIEWDQLIQIYHAELRRILKHFEYPKTIVSLTELQGEILSYGMFGVIFAFNANALRFLENVEDVDVTKLLLDTDDAVAFRRKMFESPELKERMVYLLDYFERKGFLDGLEI